MIILLFQPYIRINRACTASACMGLISPRDFVDVVTTRETDEGISTNGIPLPFTVRPVLNSHSQKRPKIGFQDQLSLNAGQTRGAFCNTFDLP